MLERAHLEKRTESKTGVLSYFSRWMLAIALFNSINIGHYVALRSQKDKLEKTIEAQKSVDSVQDKIKKAYALYDADDINEILNSTPEAKQADKIGKKIANSSYGILSFINSDENAAEETTANAEEIKNETKIVDKEALEPIFATFPKGWVSGEIRKLRLYNQEPKNDQWADFNRVSEDVTFYPYSKNGYTISQNINIALSHEFGHANDWVSDHESTLGERLDLLLAITDRLQSSDRYDSWNSNKAREKLAQGKRSAIGVAEEYWADICQHYFSNPENMNYQDFRLVDDWVKKVDPDFDVKKAYEARTAAIRAYEAGLKK